MVGSRNLSSLILVSGKVLGLLALYVAAGKLGLSLAFINASATAVWPPTGIAIAALVILGYRYWPVIGLGALIVNLTTTGDWVGSVLIAAGNTIEGLAGAYFTQRFAKGLQLTNRIIDTFKFFALAGVASPALSATIGVGSLIATGSATLADSPAVWLTWWLGDCTGALLVAPFILSWFHNRSPIESHRAIELGILTVLLVGLDWLVFGGFSDLGLQHYPVYYLMLPLLVWFAFRFGPRETASINLVVTTLAIVGTLQGHGPFAGFPNNEALLMLQGYMGLVTITTLSLSSLVAERQRFETALALSEHKYRSLVETASDVIVTFDLRGRIVYINSAGERVFGYAVEEMIGQGIDWLLVDNGQRPLDQLLTHLHQASSKKLSHERCEWIGRTKGGRDLPLEISFVKFVKGGEDFFTGLARDISERKRAEESQRWLAILINSSNDAIVGKTLDGTVVSWNKGAEKIYGYTAEEMIGQSISRLAPPEAPDEIPRLLQSLAKGQRVRHLETERIRKDGQRISLSMVVSPIKDETGAIVGASSIARDITDRRQAIERLEYLSQHDPLTSLPNRFLLQDRLQQAMVGADRYSRSMAVLLLDLDEFKRINDNLGHHVGDLLLQAVASRLQECLREADTAARYGGDEFVLVLPNLGAGENAMVIAQKVLEALREPYTLDGQAVSIGASIGISLYPGDGTSAEALLRAADEALYYAKGLGRNNFQFFARHPSG